MSTKNAPFPKALMFSVMLLFTCGSIIAQKQITGKIFHETSTQPVAGATVKIKGTTVATVSGADGSFTISSPKDNPILVVSYIGFEDLEVVVGKESNISVTLRSSVNNLNEIFVTGYTAQKKKEITGAVAVVKPAELTKVAAPSFGQQIEGRASGVAVTTSGAPGDGASIRIRGNSTFTNGGGNPLIVIDGLQIRGAFQNAINPNDIESIQILKDAAATAAYGIGANAGVIIITTKRGKSGQAKVEYHGYYGSQTAIKGYDEILLSTAQEYADLVFQSYNNSGQWPQDPTSIIARIYGTGPAPVLPEYVNPLPAFAGDPDYHVDPSTYSYPDNLIMKASPGTNWWDAVFHTAPMTEHNLNVSGGTEKGRYFMSVNYFDQEGTMRYTNYQRYTVRANTEFKVKSFTFGENLSTTFSNGVGQPAGNQVEQNVLNQGILKMQPIIPVYDIAGNWGGTKAGFGNGKNGLAQAYRNKDNKNEYFRMLGNVFGEVTFLRHFTGRVNFGVDYGTNFRQAFQYIDYESNEALGSNGFNEQTDRYYRWLFNQQLTYNNTFGEHSLRATAVHEAQLNKFRTVGGSLNGYFLQSTDLWYLQTGLADPATRTVNSSGSTDNAKESWLGRIEYGFKGKYLLNGTIRYDQSSNFPVEKGQTFGGIGVAWRLSDENFMKNATWINDLKLRGSWGVTGNDVIDPSRAYTSYGGGPGFSFYDINGTNTSVTTGYSITRLGNAALRWEKQQQVDVGVDAVFLNNRLSISADYYNRSNKDFLFPPQQPGTAGLYGTVIPPPYKNIGKISNKGFEFSATWKDVIAREWRYDITVNLTFNKNNIDELAPDLGLTNFFASTPESRIGPLVRHEQGQPMGTFYGYTVDGIFQNQAEVDKAPTQNGAAIGRFRWKDINGDGKIDDTDKGAIGDPNPDVIYGFNLNLAYKNFDFAAFFQGAAGNEIFNYTRYFTDFFGFSGNRSKRMLYESWTPERTDAKLPMLDITDNYSFVPSSYYVENGAYLRCRVLQLGYRVSPTATSKIGIDNIRVYVQAQNLFTITDYGGLDPVMGTRDDNNNPSGNSPEQWSGVDYGNYPNSRILMIGLNITF